MNIPLAIVFLISVIVVACMFVVIYYIDVYRDRDYQALVTRSTEQRELLVEALAYLLVCRDATRDATGYVSDEKMQDRLTRVSKNLDSIIERVNFF